MKQFFKTFVMVLASVAILGVAHDLLLASGPYFTRVIAQAIEFRQDGTLPAATDGYIARDNSGDLTLNALTGQTVNVAVNAVDEVSVSATQVDFNGNELLDASLLNVTDEAIVVIATDTIAVTQTFHVVRAQTGTTDSVATITGGAAGDLLVLMAVAGDSTIFLDVDGGNINGTDRSLDNLGDVIVYINDGTNFVEVSFSDND